MRNAVYMNLALCCLLVACGEASAPPQATPPAPPAKSAAPEAAPAAGKPDAAKPDAPEPEVPKADAAPAPSARVTKDAKGQDWASHMGDIAFTFDSCAAAERAEKDKRALMMYFTSPS